MNAPIQTTEDLIREELRAEEAAEREAEVRGRLNRRRLLSNMRQQRDAQKQPKPSPERKFEQEQLEARGRELGWSEELIAKIGTRTTYNLLVCSETGFAIAIGSGDTEAGKPRDELQAYVREHGVRRGERPGRVQTVHLGEIAPRSNPDADSQRI